MQFVEIAKFKLKSDAAEGQLVAVEKRIRAEVGPSHKGYLGRALLRAGDGSYTLIMRWADASAAKSWNGTLFSSEPGKLLGAMVDPTSMSKDELLDIIE